MLFWTLPLVFGGITDHKLPGTKSEIRELDITLKDLSSIQKPRNKNDWKSKNIDKYDIIYVIIIIMNFIYINKNKIINNDKKIKIMIVLNIFEINKI